MRVCSSWFLPSVLLYTVYAVSVTVCTRVQESSICLIIQETGTHYSVGSWGIQSRSATFISKKKQTERTYVVFSILHKIRKDSDCAQGTAALLNEESTVEKI